MRAAAVQHVLGMAAVVAAMGWDRFAIVLVVLIGSTALAGAGKIDAAAVIGLYAAVLGFVFGKAPTMGSDLRKDGESS